MRRRILELLEYGDLTAGEVTESVTREFGISQPAVSQHLRVLRESGFTKVRPQGTHRIYSLDPIPFQKVDRWLQRFRHTWEQRYEKLDSLLEQMKEEEDGRQA